MEIAKINYLKYMGIFENYPRYHASFSQGQPAGGEEREPKEEGTTRSSPQHTKEGRVS